ncbi:hypothetical protein J6590_080745 [Homalodisca vitripennis]|nr:hypothetical protein J6590_080745 [Homalodisca vitripennis]
MTCDVIGKLTQPLHTPVNDLGVIERLLHRATPIPQGLVRVQVPYFARNSHGGWAPARPALTWSLETTTRWRTEALLAD